MPEAKLPKNSYTANKDDLITLYIRRLNGDLFPFSFDADQRAKVEPYVWRVSLDAYGNAYAMTGRRGDFTLLHRMLAETPDHQECRFLDHDLTNLRRSNLANGTHHETMTHGRRATLPKSGYSHVSWYPRCQRWVVKFKRAGGTVYLGSYQSVREAVAARDDYLARENSRPTQERVGEKQKEDLAA